MKCIFLVILFFANTSWGGTVTVVVGPAPKEQFEFKIKDNPMEIGITKGSDEQEQILKMPHTVSDAAKLHVVLEGKNGTSVVQELLFVVLSSGAREQLIRIYAPVRSKDVLISNRIDPICSIKNYGDFYWDSSSDLQNKLRMEMEQKTASLMVKIKTSDTQKALAFTNSGCSFRLLKN